MPRYRIGLVGFGKIARERHAPAIAGNPDFELACVADPHGAAEECGVPGYGSHQALLARGQVDVVAVCTPPAARFAVAWDALQAGKHVLLEKPPTATVGELEALVRLAAARGLVLFAAWHSQHNPAVDRAREVLSGRVVTRLRIDWQEDAERYHPGQTWIWEPGGYGVFDAGVNGLSILSRLFGDRLFVRGADLTFMPGRQAPIAAELEFAMQDGADLRGSFDWRGGRPERREIRVETAAGGAVALTASGGRLVVDGQEVMSGPRAEYPLLYAHFAELLRTGRSEVDCVPLRLVADAFLVGRRLESEPPA